MFRSNPGFLTESAVVKLMLSWPSSSRSSCPVSDRTNMAPSSLLHTGISVVLHMWTGTDAGMKLWELEAARHVLALLRSMMWKKIFSNSWKRIATEAISSSIAMMHKGTARIESRTEEYRFSISVQEPSQRSSAKSRSQRIYVCAVFTMI